MEILGHLDQYAVLVLLFALARRLVTHMTVLIAMTMVLRGSQPGERPRLLRGFAECLPFLGGPAREPGEGVPPDPNPRDPPRM